MPYVYEGVIAILKAFEFLIFYLLVGTDGNTKHTPSQSAVLCCGTGVTGAAWVACVFRRWLSLQIVLLIFAPAMEHGVL